MINEEKIRESLRQVLVPGVKRSLVDMNLVREISITEQNVKIILASSGLNEAAQNWIEARSKDLLETLTETSNLEIAFVEAKAEENENSYQTLLNRIAEEEKIREKFDAHGNRWTKVYFGGGTHFENWLSQVIELKGKSNVEVEEADSKGFQCFEESGEKMYRIWVKNTGTLHQE
jgi:metal-sulfur cluster biosynthetic enzyme